MSDETLLREKARELIETGKLPNRRPDRMWGGHGDGADCPVCRAPVTREEVEYELEFERKGDDRALDTYHFHIDCLRVWESERAVSGAASADPPGRLDRPGH
jgi:hypothetical protein